MKIITQTERQFLRPFDMLDVETMCQVLCDPEKMENSKFNAAIMGGNYQARTEYIFTRLNEIKPEMIEEATTRAREVAIKFAEDSKSKLGKIKRASQGQFSINARDKNNQHIKRIRVVSTVEYY